MSDSRPLTFKSVDAKKRKSAKQTRKFHREIYA